MRVLLRVFHFWTVLSVILIAFSLLILLVLVGSGSQMVDSIARAGAFQMAIDDPILIPFEIAALVSALLATAYARRREGLSWEETGLGRARAARDTARGLALGVATFAIVPLVTLGLGLATIEGPGLEPQVFRSLFLSTLVLLPAAAFEELMLRGIPLALYGSRGRFMGIVLTSLSFSFLHMVNPGSNPIAFAGVFTAGVVLAIMRLRSGALWVPIGWHLGWNLAQGWLFGAVVSGAGAASSPLSSVRFEGPQILTGSAFGPESGLFALAADLIVLGIYVRWMSPAPPKSEAPPASAASATAPSPDAGP